MEQGQWTWAGEEGYRWLRAAGGTRRHGVAVAVADGGAGTVEGLSRRGQRIVATAATKWSTSASTLSTARLGFGEVRPHAHSRHQRRGVATIISRVGRAVRRAAQRVRPSLQPRQRRCLTKAVPTMFAAGAPHPCPHHSGSQQGERQLSCRYVSSPPFGVDATLVHHASSAWRLIYSTNPFPIHPEANYV